MLENAEQNTESRPGKQAPEKRADGYYAFYTPGEHRREAVEFFRERVGEERYREMADSERFIKYPYVAAKILLSREDWNRYVWIEQHGSLEGFVEQ